jgi:hypothetical protein
MYAALIRASERWRRIRVTEFEQRQLNAIRNELDCAHAAPPAASPNATTTLTRLSSKKRDLTGGGDLAGAAGISGGVAGRDAVVDMPSANCFTFAEEAGLVEPCKDLGETVRADDVLARVYPLERTGKSPTEYRATMNGMTVARHFPGLVAAADCLAVVGSEETGAEYFGSNESLTERISR